MTSNVLTVRVLNDKIYFMICALQGAKNEAIPIHTGRHVDPLNETAGPGRGSGIGESILRNYGLNAIL